MNLDINDINFNERECIVYGKGNKERRVYIDAKAKLHLQDYLATIWDKTHIVKIFFLQLIMANSKAIDYNQPCPKKSKATKNKMLPLNSK